MRGNRLAERYYTDRATIKRTDHYVTSDGETRSQSDLLIYENVPCRISQKSLPTNLQTETVNDVFYEIKLFISPEYEIRQGDIITVTRGASTNVYVAGEPFLYADHQEVSLQRKGQA